MTIDGGIARLSLVVLAAGSGVRFGGVKQLAPVGPNGEAILDLLLERAATAGFAGAVVVTSPAIEEQMRVHLAAHRPRLPTDMRLQSSPLGTAHAVLAAREAVAGAFVVVNADDLYPADAFEMLARHLLGATEPALVAFRLHGTLIGPRPVKRALLDLDDDGRLVGIHESTVTADSGELAGDKRVSMNMWGFPPWMFDVLARAVDEYIAGGAVGEVLLPDVVGSLVEQGGAVRILRCDQPCIGITYAEDADIVRAALS